MQAQRSGLRGETMQLRTLFFQLLEVMLQGCSTSCSRGRPDARLYFYVSTSCKCLLLCLLGV